MKYLIRTIIMAIFGPLYFLIEEDEDENSHKEDNQSELKDEKFPILQILFFTPFWMCIFIRIRDNHWDSYGIGALSIYIVFWSLYHHLMRSSLMKGLRKNTAINIIVFFWNTHWLPIIGYTMLVFLMTRKNDMYVERIVPIGLHWLYIAIIFSLCVAAIVYLYKLISSYFNRSESSSEPICEEVESTESTESKKETFLEKVQLVCGTGVNWIVAISVILAYFYFICYFVMLPVRQQL